MGYLRRHAALRQPGDRPEPVSGWLFALTLAAQAILFPYLFRHGVEKARLYMMIFFVVLLALVAALAGLAGAALPQGSILFLLGAPQPWCWPCCSAWPRCLCPSGSM